MRKLFFTTLIAAVCSASAFAEYKMYLMGDTSFCRPADGFSINIGDDNIKISGNGEDASFTKAAVDGIKFLKPLVIDFSDLSASKNSPDGVTVDVVNSDVTVTFAEDFGVNHYDVIVTGKSDNGSLTINQSSKLTLTLDNLSLSAKGKSAINIVNSKNINVELIGDNKIGCSENNSEFNAAIYSEASLIFNTESDGNLSVKSNVHGIRSREGISLDNVQIAINADKDGVRANDYFILNSGSLDIEALGDGIDANKSYIIINGGSLSYKNSSTSVDVKALKCDSDLTVNGGNISLTLNGTDNKGFSTGKYEVNEATADSAFGNVIVNDGFIEVFMNGIMEDGDTSSCSALKADGDILIYGGEFNIESGEKNHRAKGLNADGDVKIYDAIINIEQKGDACRNIASENNIYIEGGKFDLYTTGGLINEGDVINESSASCIKADNGIFVSGTPEIILYSESVKGKGMNADSTIAINGGKIDCTIFGTGAKGLSCGYEFGGEIVIDGANTIVKVNIFGGGLYENDVDDSKASGIKSDGNVEIKNGKVTIDAANEAESTTFEALRGISANNNVTISGGYTKITLDDATGKTYAIKADGKVYLKKGCLEYSCPDSEVAENVKVKPSPIFIEE